MDNKIHTEGKKKVSDFLSEWDRKQTLKYTVVSTSYCQDSFCYFRSFAERILKEPHLSTFFVRFNHLRVVFPSYPSFKLFLIIQVLKRNSKAL